MLNKKERKGIFVIYWFNNILKIKLKCIYLV